MIRTIDKVGYYNSGDWVESCSVLVEDFDGRISLMKNLHAEAPVPGESTRRPQEDEDSSILVENALVR